MRLLLVCLLLVPTVACLDDASRSAEPELHFCGDESLDPGELCDRGAANGTSGAGCTAGRDLDGDGVLDGSCLRGVCGDGRTEGEEQCDEGDAAEPVLCGADCRFLCGNGRIDPGEDCDFAMTSDCDVTCRAPARCGDGRLDPDEACDPTVAPWSALDCVDACARVASCGDGIVEGDEACDPAAPTWTASSCLQNCRQAIPCGNGRLNPGEQCDDEGASPTCSVGCRFLDPCAAASASIGWASLLVRRADGHLLGAGADSEGVLSGPAPMGSEVPLATELTEEVPLVTISLGERAGAGIDAEGRLWTFGSNAAGQRGVGGGPAEAGRSQVALPMAVRSVAVGHTSVWLVGVDGSLWSFGLDRSGALGLPREGIEDLLEPCELGRCARPRPIGPPGVRFSHVDGFHSSAIALDTGGHLWGWGFSAAGNLGPPTPKQVERCESAVSTELVPCEPEPKLVVADLAGITAASAGAGQTAFVQGGRLFGVGNYHQLGLPTTDPSGAIQSSAPVLLAGPGDAAQGQFVGVGLGDLAGLAWTADGTLHAFGATVRSPFGAALEGAVDGHQPLARLPLAGAVQDADIAWSHSFVLLRDGRVLTMGGVADAGRLGRPGANYSLEAMTPAEVTLCP